MAGIEVDRISRRYHSRTGVLWRQRQETEAVREVSFAVRQGELFGLLGPNGAGKTTIIKMLTTLLLPTSGSARVLGHDVVSATTEVRRRVGYVFGGDRGLYDRLSALDNLRYFAELYGVPARKQRRRIAQVLETVDLAGRQRERVEGFSRGMRQRLHIARGLLHDPPVIFLDEPSIGIDPIGARKLRATVAALTAVGKTVLLTTHYMYEADELCDRIAVIRDGSIVAEGTPAELKARASGSTVLDVVVYGVPDGTVERIGDLAGVRSVAVEERAQAQALLVRTEPGAEVAQAVLACLDGVTIGSVLTREPTLEDAYVELVGRS
ncbi:ABC transporter ATP-binding protein [Dactylosporangium sp. NBC_01737]|uniref:ABC transporter ATP-binding protein n=1 Tax=Dactylosporangium sp. NBC_01737 TaxID=2975959 RepID=UPI002E147213|nr:ABC transporter ATP-binding protein [Dactylosporangium sp. NBC_01737]